MAVPDESAGQKIAAKGKGLVMDGSTTIELAYEEGTIARWALAPDDPRIEQVERILGTPDTHLVA